VDPDSVTRLEPDDDGPHRMAVDLDTAAVTHELVSRICRAQASPPDQA
jgi:hypothetical protein